MAAQVGHGSAALALDLRVAIERALVCGAGRLALAKPLQGEAQAEAEFERSRVVGADCLGTAGVDPSERTGHACGDRASLLAFVDVIEGLRQPNQAVEGALALGPVELFVCLHKLGPVASGAFHLTDLAQLPGQPEQGVQSLVRLRTEAAVLRFIQPRVGSTGVGVSAELAQDAGQALESPDRVEFVWADGSGASLRQLAEARRGPAQVAQLLHVPGQVTNSP